MEEVASSHMFGDSLGYDISNASPRDMSMQDMYDIPQSLLQDMDWTKTLSLGQPIDQELLSLANGQLLLDQPSLDPRLLPGEAETLLSPVSFSDVSSATDKSDQSGRDSSRKASTSQQSSLSSDDGPSKLARPTAAVEVRKQKRTRRSTASASTDDQKRSKFLERNRVAASKCREKKKLIVSDLEETKRDVETQNAKLHVEYESLLGEVSTLKHILLGHCNCSDATIDAWLSNEAKRFVQNTVDFSKYLTSESPESKPSTAGQSSQE